MSEPLDLEAIKKRLAAATPGPLDGDCAGRIFEPGGLAIGKASIGKAYSEADRVLWQNAPTDIATLIAEVERLRAALRPFADEAARWIVEEPDERVVTWPEDDEGFCLGDLRVAAALLPPEPGHE